MSTVRRVVLYLFIPLAFTDCGSKSNVGVNNPSNFNPTLTGPNVVPVTVGQSSVCGQKNVSGQNSLYPNEPCASVTICVPGTSNCQTISDVLIDTGSTGLRVFSSLVTLSLPAVTDSSSNPLAECAQFGTGTDWGPVVSAQIGLASEPKVQTPIQLINYSYATVPSVCAKADTTPPTSGYNGILGVGLFKQDCGTYCQTHSNNIYYSCVGSTCTATTVPVASQLQNPISLLPTDNNGLIFEMPYVDTNGGAVAAGSIVLGIGTQTNNSTSGVTTYAADNVGNFTTSFNGQTYSQSFTDSGSNALFFPSNITTCSPSGGFYCPSSTVSASAINTGANAGNQIQINFQIVSAATLFNTNNFAFTTLGGSISLGGFDWGLPFFFGRKVFVGIDSTKSSLGTGPYWAF